MKLSTLQRLSAITASVAVLRVLAQLDQRLSYQGYATAIGIMKPNEKWKVWHLTQVSDVLDATAKLAREPLDFNRIVNAATGEPGTGVFDQPEIHP